MKDLIKHIVHALVDHPEQVAISEVESKARLNHWIRQYVSDPEPRYKPLRSAQIILDEGENEGYSCRFLLKVMPNFKYMGAYFKLSLVGILG